MAREIRYFKLNTGDKIPSIGLGTWQSEPGLVGQAVEAAIKVSTELSILYLCVFLGHLLLALFFLFR